MANSLHSSLLVHWLGFVSRWVNSQLDFDCLLIVCFELKMGDGDD